MNAYFMPFTLFIWEDIAFLASPPVCSILAEPPTSLSQNARNRSFTTHLLVVYEAAFPAQMWALGGRAVCFVLETPESHAGPAT